MGHGGYAEGVKKNLEMIAGQPENMYYIDLTKEDDLASLESRVKELLAEFPEDEVLFACDLLGASPFRVAAMQCADHPGKYITVAGLNTMAFIEISMMTNSDLSIEELANLAIETTKAAVTRFPE
jgi:Phosphotransferase system, mannose/fructose-specific component IIA